jgi:hypothetical protein
MLWIITAIIAIFIGYIIYKDPTITKRSISYSYYEDRETAVVWGSFAGVVGMLLIFSFPSIITLIAGICLTLVPIMGNFNKKPITYIHYSLAISFFSLMIFYAWSFITLMSFNNDSLSTFMYSLPAILSGSHAAITLTALKIKKKWLSVFWIEIIGIIVILIGLFIKTYII